MDTLEAFLADPERRQPRMPIDAASVAFSWFGSDRLPRPAFDLYRTEWPSELGVEFHLSHADWIRTLRAADFIIEDLSELRPDADAVTRFPFVTVEWARQCRLR